MRLKQYLREKFAEGFNHWSGYVEIFVNPSRKEMNEALKQGSTGKTVRFIADGKTKKLYVWSIDVLHALAWKELGFTTGGGYAMGNNLAGIAERHVPGPRWIMTEATSLVNKKKYDWSWAKQIEITDYVNKWSR